ncbi:hypothetical protein [Streptomyces sp. NPDC051079]|uniref:hypothetical protein n=1 Tax=unclassified Streptomyces TaxID=2593676 RepID=UPI00344C1222
MERRSKATVQPPNARGLREVRVGGETAGSAWSPRELRRLLRRHGYPEDVDLEDRSIVSWHGGGSEVWPDRTGRRRATMALIVAGLVGGWALLTSIGVPDAFDALTFAGRISGFLFILAGVTEVAAAVAAVDFWGKRGLKVSGALVLVGVLIALTVSTLLVFLWFQEVEYTPYLLAFFPLFAWSLWALWVCVREKVWRGVPHPTKIAAGVTATALLAAVNLAYSAVYQPTAAPANLTIWVRFGEPRADLTKPVHLLPVTLRLKNTGTVPLYILADNWRVFGRSGEYVAKSEELRDRRSALETGSERQGDASLHLGSITYTALGVGPFTGPGSYYEPGEEYSEDKMVEVPKDSSFDMIDADLDIQVMRMDRGRIDLNAFAQAEPSWDKETPDYCDPKECGEILIYRSPVRYGNNLINVTRKPRYVTAWWGLGTSDSGYDASISTFKGKGRIDDAETRREYRRFGLFTVTADAAIPFASVVHPNGP